MGVEFCNMVGKIRWIYKFFVKIILQVKLWRVKIGVFSAIPPYLYPLLFLPAIIKRTKVFYFLPDYQLI